MIDSIYIAASGLASFQQGLRTISDNVANMNTPGFKGSQAQFAEVFLQQGGNFDSGDLNNSGGGVESRLPLTNFTAGTEQQTGRDLDLAITGPGFFVVQDSHGQSLYTKNGHFELNADGKLVTMDQGYTVMGLHGSSMSPISLGDLKNSAPAATTAVTLSGNLSADGTDHTVDNVKTYDKQGGLHTLKFQFHRLATDAGSTAAPGAWSVTVTEGSQTLTTGQVLMANSKPDPTADRVAVPLVSPDKTTTYLNVILGSDVTGNVGGSTSTVVVQKTDGNAAGTITQTTVDDTGTLKITYSNTLTATGPQLALAEFAAPETLARTSGTYFKQASASPMRLLAAGSSNTIKSGSLELSNVDLTDQFSTMVLVQRGFQASSQVMTTASDMIQTLFEIKSHK